MRIPIAASLSVDDVMAAVENLPESVLVVNGVVTGRGLHVELDNLSTFVALAARSGVVYLDLQTWINLAADVADIPTGLGSEPARLSAWTVIAGVAHVITGADARYLAQVQAMQRSLDQQDADWEAERAEEAARIVHVVEDIESSYPDRLVADEPWLVTLDQRGRQRIARAWAAADYPDVCNEQRVKTALLNAVSVATERRDRDIVPARLAAFEEDLEAHAQRLAEAPGWKLATTRAVREAHARRYIGATDSLIAPTIVLDRLIAQATHLLADPNSIRAGAGQRATPTQL